MVSHEQYGKDFFTRLSVASGYSSYYYRSRKVDESSDGFRLPTANELAYYEYKTGVERIAGISARDVETGDDVELTGVESLILGKEYPNGEGLENDVRKTIEQNNPDLEINNINFSDDEVNF